MKIIHVILSTEKLNLPHNDTVEVVLLYAVQKVIMQTLSSGLKKYNDI